MACLGLGALLPAGCGGNKHIIDLDYHFSMNVARTPLWFPDPKLPLAAAEKEVIARYGRPDFIRFWWRTDGSFISSADLSGRLPENVVEDMAHAAKSWIYMGDKIEVLFQANGSAYRTEPIGDELRLICTFGDPSNKSTPVTEDGRKAESWQWIDHGLSIKLIDGREVKRSYFQGTGQGTIIGK